MRLKKGADHFEGTMIVESSHPESVFLEAPLVEELPKKERNKLDEWVTGHQSILIVDDNAQIRSYIAEIFEEKFTIYEAGTGEEGLQLANQYVPDIVISDVVMPGSGN